MDEALERGRIGPRSTLWALLGVIILFSWDLAIVQYNYGGNWTALFRTGDLFPVPTALSDKTLIFSNNHGYDGQFYRYVALDPFWLDRRLDCFDDVSRRYTRILVPLAAYLLALGNPNLIDSTYFVAIGALIFLGVFWLSRWAVYHGRHPAWGLAFTMLPSSIISATMMTVDVGVLAIAMGFGYFMERKQYLSVYPLVLLAPLFREAGALLLAGSCLYLLIQKKRRLCLLMGTAGLPALVWLIYVQIVIRAASEGSALPKWLMEQPITGIFRTMVSTFDYGTSAYLNKLIGVFDQLSLAAMILAFVLIGLATLKRPLSPIALTGGLFIVLAIVVNNSYFWAVPIGYLRPFSIVFGFLLMLNLSRLLKRFQFWLAWVVLTLTSLRTACQFVYTEFFRTVN